MTFVPAEVLFSKPASKSSIRDQNQNQNFLLDEKRNPVEELNLSEWFKMIFLLDWENETKRLDARLLCGAAGREVTSLIRNPWFEPRRKEVEMKTKTSKIEMEGN